MLVDFCKWNFPMNSHPHQLDGWMVGVSVGILFNNFLIAQEVTLPTLLSDRLSKSSRQNMGWPENNQNTSYQPFTTPGEKRKATLPPAFLRLLEMWNKSKRENWEILSNRHPSSLGSPSSHAILSGVEVKQERKKNIENGFKRFLYVTYLVEKPFRLYYFLIYRLITLASASDFPNCISEFPPWYQSAC